MNILGQKENIAGLSIDERSIRILLLSQKGEVFCQKYYGEVPLEKGIVENGELKNPQSFLNALKKIITGLPKNIKEVIVSLPDNLSYETILRLPKQQSPTQLISSVQTQLEMISPIPLPESYWDLEEYYSKEKDQKELLVSVAAKQKIENFNQVIIGSGLHPVAIETHTQSLKRALSFKEKASFLALISPSGIQSSIIKENILYFTRFHPWGESPEQGNLTVLIKREVAQVLEFFLSEHPQESVKEIILIHPPDFAKLSVEKTLSKELKIPAQEPRPQIKFGKTPPWLSQDKTNFILLGAALRGLIPRAKDKFISLMETGTEELFAQARLLAGVRIFADFLVILSVVFGLIFAGSWAYLSGVIQPDINKRLEIKQALPVMKDIQDLERKTTEYNQKVSTLTAINAGMPDWTMAIGDIEARIRPGITLNRMSLVMGNDTIPITGKAETIGHLIDFKNMLYFSGLFTGDFRIPFPSFEKGTDIDFSFSLKFKNQKDLYPFEPPSSILPVPASEI